MIDWYFTVILIKSVHCIPPPLWGAKHWLRHKLAGTFRLWLTEASVCRQKIIRKFEDIHYLARRTENLDWKTVQLLGTSKARQNTKWPDFHSSLLQTRPIYKPFNINSSFIIQNLPLTPPKSGLKDANSIQTNINAKKLYLSKSSFLFSPFLILIYLLLFLRVSFKVWGSLDQGIFTLFTYDYREY